MLTRKQAACRHGTFTFFENDMYVGKSLEKYGEFSEDEVSVFRMVLRPDDLAIEVGSNIGALTVPLSRHCQQVMAFEPFPENYGLLIENLIQNNVENVYPYCCAISSVNGKTSVPEITALGHTNFGAIEIGNGTREVSMRSLDSIILDELKLERKIKFIKIDAEGNELDILKGSARLIARDRPILYVENDRQEKSAELVGFLLDLNYRLFWHRPPLFNRENFKKNNINVFGNTISLNMVCVSDESGIEVDRLEEVSDQRIDSQMYSREGARMLRLTTRNPDDLEARFKAAHYANLNGDIINARKYIAENLKRDPEHVGTLAIRGLLDLQSGNFSAGWPAYELRYKQKEAAGFGFRPHDAPHWDGKPTNDCILLWSEQGFGDSIMFIRFINDVSLLAPNFIVEVQPQLYELFEISFPWLVANGQLYRLGRAMPKYSCHCSLPSLPATLGLKNESDLIRHNAYLRADKTMVNGWLKRDTPRIGVCLKGGAASERAYSRDMPANLMEPLAEKYGPFISLSNEGQWESYADTAAAIAALDLVITVDTSVAHLSGALGVPTWLLLSSDPDWRWQRERIDSPWYSSMRIFRQKQFMDWSNVIEEVSYHFETRIVKAA